MAERDDGFESVFVVAGVAVLAPPSVLSRQVSYSEGPTVLVVLLAVSGSLPPTVV